MFFPTVYNMYMTKLYVSSGILAQTRVVVKAEADFPIVLYKRKMAEIRLKMPKK